MTEPMMINYDNVRFAMIHLPGTSSVCGSLNIPRFHLRRGVSFSCVDVAVETAPPSEVVRSFRQGVKFTMPSIVNVVPGRKHEEVACKVYRSPVVKDTKPRCLTSPATCSYSDSRGPFSTHTDGPSAPRCCRRTIRQLTRCGVSISTLGEGTDMWLLRPKRVLAEECYRWSMVVHIAATAFSVGAMTHSQAACDHERCKTRTIGRLALHRQYPGLHPGLVATPRTATYRLDTRRRTVAWQPHVH
jgi:hypothetical protein